MAKTTVRSLALTGSLASASLTVSHPKNRHAAAKPVKRKNFREKDFSAKNLFDEFQNLLKAEEPV